MAAAEYVARYKEELGVVASILLGALAGDLASAVMSLEQIAGGGPRGSLWHAGSGPLPGDLLEHFEAALATINKTKQAAKCVTKVSEIDKTK